MRHGILIINKERGLTSHQVVARLRRILKQTEAGHSGTLDPEATGVLVVGLGQATRSFSFLDESTKVYQAEIILGQSTDTQDATGRVLQERPDTLVQLNDLQKAIGDLTGLINQIPPMFSAVKIHGEKLYDLARKGLEVERAPRQIRVSNWELLNPQTEYAFRDSIFVRITCSKGTYIRTLIHDLGFSLGVGAHMGSLVRLKSGKFSLDDSLTLDQVQVSFDNGTLDQRLIPLLDTLDHLITLRPSPEDVSKVLHGGKISFQKYACEADPGTVAKVLNQFSQVIAVVRLMRSSEETLTAGGGYFYWQPVKVFNYQ